MAIQIDIDASGNALQTGGGITGQDGIGLPAGGTIGQMLAKASTDDFDAGWIDPPAGGGGGGGGTVCPSFDEQPCGILTYWDTTDQAWKRRHGYVRQIDCGAGPNVANTTKTIPHQIPNVLAIGDLEVLMVDASNGGFRKLNHVQPTQGTVNDLQFNLGAAANATNIYIYAGNNRVLFRFLATLWYVCSDRAEPPA